MEKTKWVIDPTHSKIGFKVKHLMISNVLGNFKQFEGEVLTDGDNFENAEIKLTIDAASVDTEIADRDTHLKSADFFNAEKYPKLTFSDAKIVDLGDDTFEMKGNLTIKDVTKPVKLTVEFGGIMKDPWGNEKSGFSITGKINRKDWGLTWNAALEAGGVLVGEDVKIIIDVELLKQK
ncbi:MAG TPA: YceI family protein [Ignavibacteria bacterium]|nr:YceI family protein [Ignavibacteria bacterium]